MSRTLREVAGELDSVDRIAIITYGSTGSVLLGLTSEYQKATIQSVI